MAIVMEAGMARKGAVDHAKIDAMQQQIVDRFDRQMSVFTTSALLLDDGVIDPRDTRAVLAEVLSVCRDADARVPQPMQFFDSAAMGAFHKILIANRGEIAVRVMRTARAMGYRTVAVYSSADADAEHGAAGRPGRVDRRISPTQSYLNIAASSRPRDRRCGCSASGLRLSRGERSDSHRPADDAGLVFIGPSPKAIRAMGDKAVAKRLMQAAGVPCIPGYQGEDQGAELAAEAVRINWLARDHQG